MGGKVIDYQKRIESMRGQDVRIRGKAFSAATMYLKIACVYPSAKLAFHSPSNASGERTRFTPLVESIMVGHYPPEIADWYYENAQHLVGASNYAVMTGAEAIALGARPC